MTVRTRFAPSPTGYLHVGGVRTALFSWLYARKQGGKFVLRIEDTDQERSTEASVNAILEGMAWLGLDYDEGPFYQTQRFDRYRQVIQQLLNEGKAYYCYCSKERLENLRESQLANKEKPRYDKHCRHLAEGSDADTQPVIRFKNPETGQVVINDLIKGTVIFDNQELDDLIIARSNGTPTYNFTVVIDDWDMQISHVIRGDDHLNNTPRQINILSALGATIPQYAHLPMILGDDGKRLSKRHGAVSVTNFRDEGYLPQALLNYLVRLGWSHGDQEIFSAQEMLDLFDIKNVNASAATFNNEKLLWLNQHYIKTLAPKEIAIHFQFQCQHLGLDTVHGPDLTAVIESQAERAKNLREMAENSHYFFSEIVEHDEKALFKHLKPALIDPMKTLSEQLEHLEYWQTETIHSVIHSIAEKFHLKLGKIAQPLRVAVTGNTISPPIDTTVYLIGKARSIARIQVALSLVEHHHQYH